MVDRITGSIGKEALLAAIRDQAGSAQGIRDDAAKMFQQAMDPSVAGGTPGTDAPKPASSVSSVGESLKALNADMQVASPDQMAADLATGQVDSIHDVAMRMKRAKISFDFALEVRNKLIEAYRETMRMGV